MTQFDLVCSSDYLVTISQSVYMLGILVGVVVSGVISDKYVGDVDGQKKAHRVYAPLSPLLFCSYGRKYTIMSSAVLLVIFGCAAAYSSSFILFMVLRFCIAFCSISCFTTAFVYCETFATIKSSNV